MPAKSTYRQPLLTDPERGWREIEQAMDAAGEKFGRNAVQRLALVRRPVGSADPWAEHAPDRPLAGVSPGAAGEPSTSASTGSSRPTGTPAGATGSSGVDVRRRDPLAPGDTAT